MKKVIGDNKVFKAIKKTIKKRFKLWRLLFIALLFTCNSFAWFIYMNKIDSDIDVKVKAWNVAFRFDNQTMSDYIKFDVSAIYPGMDDYREEVFVTNDGDVSAKLYYEIESIQIFDQLYQVSSNQLSSEEIEEKLDREYPFKIKISTSHDVISSNGGKSSFIVVVSWPYETVNDSGSLADDKDTYWGNKAYSYVKANPNLPCIRLNVKLSATQLNE